jgi:tetratricopeptide (TPR) repeat protein
MDAPQITPDSARDYFLAAQSLLEQGEIAEAISLFKRASDLEPGRADFYFYLGYSYQLGQELDRSVQHYRLALDPDLADAHHNLDGSPYAIKKAKPNGKGTIYLSW